MSAPTTTTTVLPAGTIGREDATALAVRIQSGDLDEWIHDLQRILTERERARVESQGIRAGALVRVVGEEAGNLDGLTATVIRVSKKTVTIRVHVGQDPGGLPAEEITRTLREARRDWEESGSAFRPFLGQIPLPSEYRVSPGLLERVEDEIILVAQSLATRRAHEWWTEGAEA